MYLVWAVRVYLKLSAADSWICYSSCLRVLGRVSRRQSTITQCIYQLITKA